jgi:hypothetical protein
LKSDFLKTLPVGSLRVEAASGRKFIPCFEARDRDMSRCQIRPNNIFELTEVHARTTHKTLENGKTTSEIHESR